MSKAAPNRPPVSLSCAVLTISDTRDSSNDTSGDYLVDSLLAAGHRCDARAITPSNLYQIRKIISDWIANDSLQVIITNGGTGFTHGKSTVDAISPLLDQTITGFGELFRHLSYQDIGSSTLQSDAFAGAANNTLVFCVPGSTGACKTAWEGIIKEQLDSTHRPCNFGSHYHA
ncbi:molybdenum cofactor biosynthesis protein B [Pollutimonas harenae]|uniref:Molybdenum cofactor biosynthesis protein B n=1 Tax=Pollutimonas harenae TaxID=657015 RepID=A0A853GWX4_9BURK|nr:molybdenum cofactor biosynthesis protein B [Pollutimonas harenae]NYT86851.1 molybdenum cofactor biosynthesis protein B [Pollutimonas harenae]TEA69431.1 molybdenum cofactor biosynthesis protein B [Pollutimonas harenae]